jgi:hypothetical protein
MQGGKGVEKSNMASDIIDVRPDVGIFNVIQHLSYKPHYALAEYIDNSISSWENNRAALLKLDPKYKLRVDVIIGHKAITVRDNAAGIAKSDYARAFKPAELPPDRTGLNEFGMGMKTASIWLSKNWRVVTSSIYEDVTGIVEFDVVKMIQTKDGKITPIFKKKASSSIHGTEIILTELNHTLRGKVLGKVQDHLSSIYRFFLRRGELDLRLYSEGDDPNAKDSILSYEDMPALKYTAQYSGGPKGEHIWQKDIDIQLSGGRRITGTAKVLAVGSTAKAGLYLFRRGRVIHGASEPYRPSAIFGSSNSFEYQRISGELTMEGFAVTHTKDGFIWGAAEEDEDEVIDRIHDALESGELNLIAQAKDYHPRKLERPEKREKAIETGHEAIEHDMRENAEELGEVVSQSPSSDSVEETPVVRTVTRPDEIFKKKKFSPITLNDDESWEFTIEAIQAGDMKPLFESNVVRDDENRKVECTITINLEDPFACNYINRSGDFYDIICRFAVAACVAQENSKMSGNQYADVMVSKINKTLTKVLSGNFKA